MSRCRYFSVIALLVACAKPPLPDVDAGADLDAGVDAGQGEILPLPDHFVELGTLHEARLYHSATVLQSGRVLILGGEDENSTVRATAELVDPVAKTVESFALPEPVTHHTATLLDDGRVLVAGGGGDMGSFYPSAVVTGHCWLFDPLAKAFTATGALHVPRGHHVAVKLHDGRVLVVGGGDGTLQPGAQLANATASAEVFDPVAGTWKSVGAMHDRRVFHTANLLPNGHVLVAGGVNETAADFTSVEDFDPAAETFSMAPSLAFDRFRHTAAVLGDGTLLVAAGKKSNVRFLDAVELLVPGASAFVAGPPVVKGGNSAAMVALGRAHALFVGGYGTYGGPTILYEYLAQAQRFDLATRSWRQLGRLHTARTAGTLSVLPSGQVLVAGGLGEPGVALASLEVSEPCLGCEASLTGVVGRACSEDSACVGAGRAAACRLTTSSANKPYVGGYCTNACETDGDCPSDALCGLALPGLGEGERVCWPRCAQTSSCRAPGYACYQVDAADAGGCWLEDSSAVDAGTPAAPGLVGSACTSDSACQPPERGTCFGASIDTTRPSGFVGGYCSVECMLGGSAVCGAGAVCLPYASGGAFCFRKCTTPSAGQGECRDGEVCHAYGAASGGYCMFGCQYNPHAACGNGPCGADGYCVH